MTSQDTQRTGTPGRLLRRRTTDRVIGGVAGGLADYFNVDPLLIRIGFVGLIIFGGAGLVLYLLAWLLMPAEGQDVSPVEGLIHRIGLTSGRILVIAVVAVVLLLLFNSWNTAFDLSSRDGLLWAVAVIAVGFLLIRRRETSPAPAGVPALAVAIVVGLVAVIFLSSFPIGGPFDGSGYMYIGPLPGLDPVAFWAVAVIVAGYLLIRRRETATAVSGGSAASAAPSGVAAPAAITPPRAPAVRRPRSPLAWYVYAAALVAVGLLGIVSQVAEVEVAPGQFFGAVLTVIGIGLVVGAWWGRARILILLALLLAPIGVMASFVTAPLEGGIGDHWYAPANSSELQDEYRSMAGRIILDLTELSVGAQPFHIAASVAVGQLVVILPTQGSVEVRARVGAGATSIFGPTDVGTSMEDRYVRHHRFGTTYILDLEAGIGEVLVEGGPLGAN